MNAPLHSSALFRPSRRLSSISVSEILKISGLAAEMKRRGRDIIILGLGGSGSLTTPANAPVKWAIADGHPFLAWGQRAAILKEAPHKAAAKLYMNCQISEKNQRKAYNGWSVRTDVQPQGGLKPVWDYANSNFAEFPRFMEDRALVERWRQTFAIYFGEVRGEPSPGWLGQRPGA
ncbi:hypothetical protein [Bradyrhizobium sp. STM 3566]|uniref:hypothetical protein n=1 Tax=Bradyrhizobium sp. STM 3566 TaxID=578928 RepID=UPI00388E0B75